MPASLDTDRLGDDLMQLFRQSLAEADATNYRDDPALYHHSLKADITKPGEAGNYWIIAGGDLVLFASSQVPAAERDVWNPPFEQLMASLRITREEELAARKLASEVLKRLRDLHPEQDYEFDDTGIVGRDHRLSVDNLYREIRNKPGIREELIERFIEAVSPKNRSSMGYEEWSEVSRRIVPVLKPRSYIKPDTATARLATTAWLADVLICYAIQSDKVFRFVTDWDCNRWNVDMERLHEVSLENLVRMEWPKKMAGTRQDGGGRLILVCTGDSFSASRLLHPDLHHLFSKPLGSPFLAGVPDRDTLVVFSNKASLRKRTGKQVKIDHDKSAYPITPRLFMVTRDGIALGRPDRRR